MHSLHQYKKFNLRLPMQVTITKVQLQLMQRIINYMAVASMIGKLSQLVLRRKVVVSKMENVKAANPVARKRKIRIAVKQPPVRKREDVVQIASQKNQAAAPANQRKSAKANVSTIANLRH